MREADDLLARLEAALLDLDQGNTTGEQVDEAFRALHTLKGSGAMFGFDDLVGFAHHFETVFEAVRDGRCDLSKPLIDVSLQGVDHMRALLDGSETPAAGAPILTALSDAREAARPPETAAANDAAPLKRFHIIFYPPRDAFRVGLKPQSILEELRGLGAMSAQPLTDRIPPVEETEPTDCYLGWDITLETTATRSEVEDVFLFVADTGDVRIEERAEAVDPDAVTPPGGASSRTANRPGVHVPAERLDSLMDQVGELVIAQSRLGDHARGNAQDPHLLGIAEEIERLVTNLRDETLQIRMVPIGTLFGRFKRVVRDLGRELGKEVHFEVKGGDTEVDKTVIEHLADPMVHIIRNAVDHGIEAADERRIAGKEPVGRLSLMAEQVAGEVHIRFSDDGAGLDPVRIRERAVERGLIGENAQLSDSELQRLIFEPGFSTAETVSNVSGRGVGMDVVRDTISALRGGIDVASTPGLGTTLTLRLPLTLAIIEGFDFVVDGDHFIIPVEAVDECLELPGDSDKAGHAHDLVSLRDSFVPIVRLHELFGFPYPERADRRIIVVRVGDECFGLVVDAIIGQRQTVIKPLSRYHRGVPGLAGATILGNGRVALLLDLQDVHRMARHRQSGQSQEHAQPNEERRPA